MKYFQETTEWLDNPKAVNHIYYMNDEKTACVGYIKAGTKSLIRFKTPIRLDLRGRKFVVSKNGEPDEVYFPKVQVPKDRIKVAGSNGKEYFLEKVNGKYTCTCPGFTFRNKCKHTDQMA